MPEFIPNEAKVAIASMSNPTAKAFSYTAELYLGLPKAASSGVISFSLAAGETRNISFPVTMPDAEGTYPVYLDVFVAGQLIGAYKAVENVVIAPAVAYTCVYDGAQFSTENDLISYMNTNYPGKPYVVYAHLINDTVYQGETFKVEAKIYVPSIPADRHYLFSFNYNAAYATPQSCYGEVYMKAGTPEGFYLKEITLPTLTHIAGVYAEPGTHIIYSLAKCRIIDVAWVSLWNPIDIGLRITVLGA